MQKKEILALIRTYINDEKTKYAVLINGDWGCGKTYLYENYLAPKIAAIENGRSDRKINVYISLYGISSVEQLAKEIVTNYILKVRLKCSDKDDKKERIYLKAAKASGIISRMLTISINGLSVDFGKGIKKALEEIEFKNMVICLDDLERCSIPVNDLFGMINNLVEHCNCKVMILADEGNIGKMYANSNIEEKYKTLLMGRRLVKEEGGTDAKGNEEITIEKLKALNEKLYSENYIYKDIKEKIIGLSLKYTPDLKEELDSIINSTVSCEDLAEELSEREEKILEYMDRCSNRNLRIVRMWLLNFERIYTVLNKYFTGNKYYNEIFNGFMVYSIRAACAVGKNIKLIEWKDGNEVGTVTLDDGFLFDRQGYKFIDDLMTDSIFDEKRVCQAARFIEREKISEEEEEKRFTQGSSYKKLQEWYYLEDDEISNLVTELQKEIERDEYQPQTYQHIISHLINLKYEELIEGNIIDDITELIKDKVKASSQKSEVENFQQSFQSPEALAEFHGYYDPIYKLIKEKNSEKDKQEMDAILSLEEGKQFMEYCTEHHSDFTLKRTFISLIDKKLLLNIIKTKTITDIYLVARGFQRVYNFDNLYEYYADDAALLKNLKSEIENIEYEGKTRKRAVNFLCETLEKTIQTIENKGRTAENQCYI